MRNIKNVHRSAAPNLLIQFALAELTLQLTVDPNKNRRSIPVRADGRSTRLIPNSLHRRLDLSCRCASARGRSAADAEAEARETKARRRSPASHTPLSAIAPRARAPACQQLSCVRRGERATSAAMLASIHPLKKPTEPLSTSAVSPRRPPLSALLVRSEAWIR
jgi:hypothetical protein